MTYEARPGDWVLCWGQVLDKRSHPEDAVVEFFSHNEQWSGDVRRDRIEQADVPDFAVQCLHLTEDKRNKFYRCELPDGHAGDHTRGGYAWGDDSTDAYLEER